MLAKLYLTGSSSVLSLSALSSIVQFEVSFLSQDSCKSLKALRRVIIIVKTINKGGLLPSKGKNVLNVIIVVDGLASNPQKSNSTKEEVLFPVGCCCGSFVFKDEELAWLGLGEDKVDDSWEDVSDSV